MPNIVFITPNFGGDVREEPIGSLLLATILRNEGMDVGILQFHHFGDASNFTQFIDTAIESVRKQNPKIISFYTRCDTYHISLRLAEQIRSRIGNVAIVFAGPQADLSAYQTLDEIPYVDYVCCGEGENTIVPLFSSLLAGEPELSVPGLCYRSNGKIVMNPRPELTADLDALPVIDYSLLDFNRKNDREIRVKDLFPVDVGRGCPFSCTYCSTKNFWGRKYRLKSAERIIEEIRCIHETFGVDQFNFEHDMFTMNRKKVIDICQKLKTIGFPIKWRCSARIDCLDPELVDIMVDAGMSTLFLGIETGSPRMQKLVHKNLNLETVVDQLRYISSKGVTVTTSFIFGFPDETEEDFEQTMRLMTEISKIPLIIIQQHLCTFFAGTELTEQYGHQLARAAVLSDTTGEVAVKECEDIITAHPGLFPHFFEYKTELREKIRHYPQFFQCWVYFRPIYEYLANKYYPNRLHEMLYDFTSKNTDILSKGLNGFELVHSDTFLEKFAEDEKYALLKEAVRFSVWKSKAKNGNREIFSFDVKSYLRGVSVNELGGGITMVQHMVDAEGNNRLAFYRMQ